MIKLSTVSFPCPLFMKFQQYETFLMCELKKFKRPLQFNILSTLHPLSAAPQQGGVIGRRPFAVFSSLNMWKGCLQSF